MLFSFHGVFNQDHNEISNSDKFAAYFDENKRVKLGKQFLVTANKNSSLV